MPVNNILKNPKIMPNHLTLDFEKNIIILYNRLIVYTDFLCAFFEKYAKSSVKIRRF